MAIALAKVSKQGGKYVVTDPRPGKSPQMFEKAEAAMAAVEAVNEEIAAGVSAGGASSKLTFKANPKGGKLASGGDAKGNIGLYGLQTRPVTLYPSQWIRMFQLGPAAIAGIILSENANLDYRNEDDRASAVAWAKRFAPTVETK